MMTPARINSEQKKIPNFSKPCTRSSSRSSAPQPSIRAAMKYWRRAIRFRRSSHVNPTVIKTNDSVTPAPEPKYPKCRCDAAVDERLYQAAIVIQCQRPLKRPTSNTTSRMAPPKDMKQTAPILIAWRFRAAYEGFCSSRSVKCQFAAHVDRAFEIAQTNKPNMTATAPMSMDTILLPGRSLVH